MDMPFPLTDLATSWPAAIAIILATIGVTSYGVRAFARRERRHHRHRHRALARTFRRYLDV